MHQKGTHSTYLLTSSFYFECHQNTKKRTGIVLVSLSLAGRVGYNRRSNTINNLDSFGCMCRPEGCILFLGGNISLLSGCLLASVQAGNHLSIFLFNLECYPIIFFVNAIEVDRSAGANPMIIFARHKNIGKQKGFAKSSPMTTRHDLFRHRP